MRVGICLPNTHVTLAEPDTMVAVAQQAEGCGFDSLWVNDHIVVPAADVDGAGDRQAQYLDRRGQMILEPTVLLSYLAACTERITLGTSVFVLALRNPVVAAKQIATLDVMSGGRVVLGVGVGWLEAEFNAVGVPWTERGHRTDLALRVAKALWGEDPLEDTGRYDLGGVVFNPRPHQAPHPPIWIGGRTAVGARRAVALGDAWHPSHLTLDELRGARTRLDALCEEAGRPASDVELTTRRRVLPRGATADPLVERRTLGGRGPEIAQDLAAMADTGVSHVVLELEATSPSELLDRIGWLSAEVLPAVAAPVLVGGGHAATGGSDRPVD
jgi:probable F420-dependent oxidoreductase